MAFARPSLTALIEQATRDILGANIPGVNPGLLPKSVLGEMAKQVAGVAHLQYGYLDYISKQAVPWSATDEYLEAHAALVKIYRVSANAAVGTVALTGTTGVLVPIGTTLRRDDGVLYISTTEATISALGTASVSISAQVGGIAGNAPAGTNMSVSPSIAGINTQATAGVLLGGAELEGDESLRSRMLYAFQNRPTGGAGADYKTWSLSVPGITRAWVVGPENVTLNGVAGTVKIYVMTDGVGTGFPTGTSGGATNETRTTPATGDLLRVANYVDSLRPVTSLPSVYAPAQQTINLTINALSPTSSAIQTGISNAIKSLLLSKGTVLGGFLFVSDVNAAIEAVAGVGTYTLAVPSSNVTLTPGAIQVLGTITYG